MISQGQPEFSGSQDEDVEIFIRQCRYKWVSPADFKASLELHTRDAAVDDAIVTTIRAGCTEIARDYINLLDLEVIDDLDRLCDALRQRFPRLDKKAMITRQIEKLKQRHEIGDYIEEGLHLAKEINSIRGSIKRFDERELVGQVGE